MNEPNENGIEKQFLVSKRYILSEVAKWAVFQSPYHRPDNLEIVLDKLNEGFGKWGNDNLGFEKFTYKNLKNFLDRELKKIPEFLLWNERKNGNQSQYKFTDRYSKDDNPDDDFIDLDALIRNVANSIIREGTEISISEILGNGSFEYCDVDVAKYIMWAVDHSKSNLKTTLKLSLSSFIFGILCIISYLLKKRLDVGKEKTYKWFNS